MDYLLWGGYVEVFSDKTFKNDPEFPSDDSKKLKWFAEKYSLEFEQKLISLHENPLKMVFVDGNKCFKKTISGRSFGFPKEKQIYLRYFRFDKKLLAITGWTVSENASNFESIINYMGMTLQPIKD